MQGETKNIIQEELAKSILDVLVVGSGPAGLSAAVYAKRASMSVKVVEKMYMGTGQVAESGRVDNYLGLPGMNGYEMGEVFRSHAQEFDVPFLEGEVCGFEKSRDCDCWVVKLSNGEVQQAQAIIYAAGAKHRHLGVPGEEEFGGRGVSYCAVCDGAFYRGKSVVVAGGGDTALDDALYLSELCEKVYLVHRRDKFRGAAATLEKLQQKENVEIITSAVIKEILGDKRVQSVALADGRCLAVSGIFIAVGMIPETECVKEIVALDESGYIVADETGRTNKDGFFAAGDVRTKQLRQVITAVSDGANAAISAAEYLRNK